MVKSNKLFSSSDRRFALAVGELTYTNPFGPRRVELEGDALGDEFRAVHAFWSVDVEGGDSNPNVVEIGARAEGLADAARERLVERGTPRNADDLAVYEDLVVYLLYHRYTKDFFGAVSARGTKPVKFYERFERDFHHYLKIDGLTLPTSWSAPHIFACFFQVRRAFHNIFRSIIGRSAASARLRGSVWESVFSRDMRRFRRALFDRMSDLTTLITGPTGTGKELVALAIGSSQYIPFDRSKQQFAADAHSTVRSVSLPALSPTLIESELFGHRKGAFTGAIEDRVGWLESSGAWGTVFLDEIGELDEAIQVKLLRVLQTKTLQRLGETEERTFGGKIIAATNRDLPDEIAKGRFREDFYYRLCSDVITTPALREQIDGDCAELQHMLRYVAGRVAGEAEADAVAEEAEAYIRDRLGIDYAWPGNFRELEQCVKSIVVRGSYAPAVRRDPDRSLAESIERGDLTVDDLVTRYCRLLYDRYGSYNDVARRTGLDWRTVKSKIVG